MPKDRLQEGENPQAIYPHDARHWIAVYQEMIKFKTELLAAGVRRKTTGGSPPAALAFSAVFSADRT